MAPLIVVGAALGGAAMYFFDPDRGRRRRALVRDKAIKAQSSVRDFVDAGTRDLASRGSALTGRVRAAFPRRKGNDQVLIERVRSKMGHHVGHPGTVEVTNSGGQVTLTGSLLAHEHEELLEAVRAVDGVKDVIDQLSVYETAEGISELQGGRERRASNAVLPHTWAPGTQLLAGSVVTWFLLRRSARIRGVLMLVAGAAVLLRITPKEQLQHLPGIKCEQPVDTQKASDPALEDVASF